MEVRSVVRKELPIELKALNEKDRTFEAVASTSTPDRMGDIVNQDGWVLENYLKNPILLWNHDPAYPIGKVLDIRVEGDKLVFKAQFAQEGTADYIDTVFELYKQGILRAFSVGFIPLEYEANEHGGLTYKKQELLEISAVAVPANAEALLRMYKSLLTGEKRDAIIQKRAVAPHDSGEIDTDTPWDKTVALAQLRKWASSDGSGDKETIDWNKYRQGFAWYDEESAENFSAYKLPHHFVKNGKLITSWRGVVAAMAALFGARGGVNIPDNEKRAVYAHLAKHYKDAGKEPPEFEQMELLSALIEEKMKNLEEAYYELMAEVGLMKSEMARFLETVKDVPEKDTEEEEKEEVGLDAEDLKSIVREVFGSGERDKTGS